jgi:peptidoglycan-N-acetylglucosamine deacetylase
MQFAPTLKQRLPWILLIAIIVLLSLLFLNRFLLFQKILAHFEKVDVFWMGYTDQKIVALTFDDGPDPSYTPQILKILQKTHVQATFFVEGANAVHYPELVRAESENGHFIGNHTFNHPHLSSLSQRSIRKEINATDQVIQKITGKQTLFFRPPYEELGEDILRYARSRRKIIVLSTVTLEHESARTPRAKAERVLRLTFPGAIILAHDGRLDRTTSVEALPYLIKGLKSKGYRIVPLSELLLKAK